MKQRKGLIPVPIPQATRNPYRIGKFSREVRKSITALANRQDKVYGRRQPRGAILPPYWPTLKQEPSEEEGEEGSDVYSVTVTEGYVVERDVKRPTDGNAIIVHTADNHFDEIDTDQLRKFTVEAGESIFVRVEINKRGEIAITPEDPPEDPEPPAVTLEVGSTADTKSEHYAPEIGATVPGQPGVYYYELARFIAGEDEGSLEMELILGGSDIDHFQELPTFENAGGATIWKEWDATNGVYKTKGITALAPLTATAQENSVELSFGGGQDFKLEVLAVTLSIDFTLETFSFGSITIEEYYWQNGIYVGQTAPSDEDYSPATQRVHYFSNNNANP